MGKRNGARKGARRSGNPARREAERLYSGDVMGERMYAATAPGSGVQPGEVIPVSVPALPDGVVLRDATPADAAALEPVMRLADPDNPDGSWRQLPTAIRQSLDADKYTRVRAVEEPESGVLVGGTMTLPAAWAYTHPMLLGSPNAHIIAGLVATLDSLAVVEAWRGKGIARALVADVERAAGAHEKGKFGAAILYVTHEPELTDFYAGLGFTLSPRRHRHPHTGRLHLPRPDQGLPLLGEAATHRRPDAAHAHPLWAAAGHPWRPARPRALSR
ncbi:GNAT family N-acetyltransferase [Streptomyces sp. NPDC058625]|uniref:GNAT family N-acetyltransferase n=1 Tax=Streptomyces sp. NPDC058625 TaxID=3346564 RepID=UPI003646ECBC